MIITADMFDINILVKKFIDKDIIVTALDRASGISLTYQTSYVIAPSAEFTPHLEIAGQYVTLTLSISWWKKAVNYFASIPDSDITSLATSNSEGWLIRESRGEIIFAFAKLWNDLKMADKPKVTKVFCDNNQLRITLEFPR